ncbi:uncharacterized protein LOC115629122 [Scaptodrosophila lebanonensis]|uniref:Uncharacterized protein LOC115629122 n=1 Tax=Drosophila lebanonensis TaxID=7225 RepID=A0A6J2TZ02_DROLE|nr:uncharacterized protein LOC115629122 [Scaptodrosophila lebanonensis]
MFNLTSKDLYGVSYEDDRPHVPHLGGNFEFRFSARGNISRAIEKYKEQRGAELAEMRGKQSKGSMPRFCKMRDNGHDVTCKVTSSDRDVETQVSRLSWTLMDLDDLSSQESYGLEEATGTGIEESCNKAMHELGATDADSSNCNTTNISIGLNTNQGDRLCGGASPKRQFRQKKSRACHKYSHVQSHSVLPYERVEALHREVCKELEDMGQGPQSMSIEMPVFSKPKSPNKKKLRQIPNKYRPVTISPPRVQLPALIKTPERLKGGTRKLKSCKSNKQGDADNLKHMSYEEYPQPEAKWAEIMHPSVMSQAIQVNVCKAQNPTPRAAYEFMECHGSVEPEPIAPFFLEDSDLEHEYTQRPGYLRCCGPRPMKLDSEPEQEDNIGACFVELEHKPHRLSLLRSMQPMRYSSRFEERVRCHLKQLPQLHATFASQESLSNQALKPQKEHQLGEKNAAFSSDEDNMYIPKLQTPAPPSPTPTTRNLKSTKNKAKASKGRKTDRSSTPAWNSNKPKPQRTQLHVVIPSYRPQHVDRKVAKSKASGDAPEGSVNVGLVRQPGGREKCSEPPSLPQESPPPSPLRRRKPRNLYCTRSLEDLKYEKICIYHKMSTMQERIIAALDRLQNSLIQLAQPEYTTHERARRQRNAFEFCVRFSRNFLYPLKGMIDDVRYMSDSAFTSANSNDACQRVLNIYNLMHQSIMTYMRQLRFFLLDKVPQKLSALIEMLYALTNVCLTKNLFDRQDVIVDCLLQRCTKFLTFIEDMQEERFQLAREVYQRIQAEKHSKQPHDHQQKSHSHNRYDLKMCFNDLQLYEPRLVRKEKPVTKERSGTKDRSATKKSTTITKGQGVVRERLRRLQIRRPVLPGICLEKASDVELPRSPTVIKTHIECVECRDDQSSELSEQSPLLSPTPNVFPTPYQHDCHQALANTLRRTVAPSPSPRCYNGTISDPNQCISRLVANLNLPNGKENVVNQALFEALQQVTQSQVVQVIEPIVRSLGGILQHNKKDDSSSTNNSQSDSSD